MPRAGWKKPVSERRLSDLVSVGVLTRVFPRELVDEVIAQAGRTEQRNRTLPARVMAYFAIGMALYSEGSKTPPAPDPRKRLRLRPGQPTDIHVRNARLARLLA